jgi:two-component system, NtrC family, sensor kinase
MSSDPMDLQARVQQLERENRILRKKLERSDTTCLELEENAQKKESLLRQVIDELKASQTRLEQQSLELNQTCRDLQRTQTQLVQAEKMSSLGQLVAGVAHEINNPVSFIHGNLNFVRTYVQDLLNLLQLYRAHYPEPVSAIQTQTEAIDLAFIQTDLSKILSSLEMGTTRIQQIVLSLRNFSRMDESETKSVNIHEGIDSALLILQHRLNTRSGFQWIQVERNYGDLPLVQCFPGQLNQALMNILVNSIDAIEEIATKHSPQESGADANRITIQTTLVESEWVQIAIADTGIGMSESVLQRVFDPFFTTKPVGKGTGMGMSISYQIITEQHGGRLNCTSQPGQGTEWIIQIPLQGIVQSTVSS